MTEKKEGCLRSPVTGERIPLSRIPDEAFAGGMLGEGFGVAPRTGEILSPIDGVVESVAESRHAYTILGAWGLDVLVHIGVDTVTLGGRGFTPRVEAGQHVRVGDRLADVDLKAIREAGLSPVVAVVISNAERIRGIEYAYGECTGGEDVAMRFCLKEEDN